MYVPETFEYDRSGGSSAHARTPQCLLTPVLSLGLGHILFYKLENVSLCPGYNLTVERSSIVC
jgi:hypothetical protein